MPRYMENASHIKVLHLTLLTLPREEVLHAYNTYRDITHCAAYHVAIARGCQVRVVLDELIEGDP